MTDAEWPARPRVTVELVADHTEEARCDRGFLVMRRLTLRNVWEDGHASAAYRYDLVEREALDAVAIVLFATGGGGPRICLRTALRPPLAFRNEHAIPIPEPPEAGAVQWEVPAGLVEPDERGEDGLRACASRETQEEVALEVPPEAFAPLGPSVCISPGVLAEKLHYWAAEVDPSKRGVPAGDGSPTEERARVRFVPLADALAACRDGRIADLKTEAAVRRLAERLGVT